MKQKWVKLTARMLCPGARSIPLSEATTTITGGAGYIGSHLCERLLDRGDEVLCVDHFFTGTRRNVHHLLAHPRFELTRHDICFLLYVEVD
jgi:UDP-glucuronate decarboxylase